MGGVRLGGIAAVPIMCTLPFTTYMPPNYEYNVFQVCGGVLESITNHVDPDFGEENNNVLLSPDNTQVLWNENFPEISPGVFSGAIYKATRLAGSTPVLMADDGGAGGDWLIHPFWNPDGVGCCYVHGLSGFVGVIEAVAFAGDTPTVLYTPDASHGPFRPQYSPDGTQIAFILEPNIGTPDADTGLWVMDADGSNVSQLDAFPNDGYGFDGSQFGWSHDSSRIVYNANQSFSGGGAEVYVIDRDGSNQTSIAINGETQARVTNRCWVADDSFVVVSNRDGGGNWRPYRMELDGTTPGSYLNADDTLETNGNQNFRTVYVNDEDQRVYWITVSGFDISTLWSMNLDGTDPVEHINDASFVAGSGIEWI